MTNIYFEFLLDTCNRKIIFHKDELWSFSDEHLWWYLKRGLTMTDMSKQTSYKCRLSQFLIKKQFFFAREYQFRLRNNFRPQYFKIF